MMTMRKKIATATALLALTTLAGCDWFKPAPPVETDNNSAVVENVDEPEAAPPAANVTTPDDTNAAAAAELRDAPPAPDAQTQDDADAVGMTAHVRRDDAAGNSNAPDR
jgi:hypothetical protein